MPRTWKIARLICLIVAILTLGAADVAHAAEATAVASTRKHHAASRTSSSKTTSSLSRKATARVRTRTSAAKATSALKSTSTSRKARTRRGAVPVATVRRSRHVRYYERFTGNSFADNVTQGDVTAGEDPVVRSAAIEALGNMNGTAVAIDPSSGRILAMVNQKLALAPGAEPCSTIKLSVALAALSEGLVTRDTMVQLAGFRMNMTQALAHSNNLYFEEMGRELGFERVHHYATEFGLGELAGYHIQGEQLGTYPDHAIPEAQGGVGRMCSFGQGVSMTPLQLGAIVAAVANGGTLYYLQHPTNPEGVASFKPMIKRKLDIARYIPDMVDGMAGAVEYGTARSLRASFHELPVFGKTGTCSDNGTRFGWFASFSTSPQGNLVTVFFFEGRRGTSGPHTAEITGQFYRSLWDHDYFSAKMQQAQDAPEAVTPVNASATSGATQ